MSEEKQPQIVLELDGIKAVNVLISAAVVAQGKGAFSLPDAKAVFDAITTLSPGAFEAPPAPPVEEDEAA
tara:strand:+ start:1181 stop:1390 length:210 start_codon:yes stop_codon:yes gene_type:complete